jgi:adenylate kinase family enzyme
MEIPLVAFIIIMILFGIFLILSIVFIILYIQKDTTEQKVIHLNQQYNEQEQEIKKEIVKQTRQVNTFNHQSPIENVFNEIDPHQGKVFQIGLNKTATLSIHKLIISTGRKSIHWKTNKEILEIMRLNISQNKPPLETIDYATAFTDFISVNSDHDLDLSKRVVRSLKETYPDSKFIFNIREPHGWLLSRLNHYTISAHGLIPQYSTDVKKQLKEELIRWHKWTVFVLELFKNDPEQIIIVDIKQPHFSQHIFNFLGWKDFIKPIVNSHKSSNWLSRSKTKLPFSNFWPQFS